jgi:hypothetical protein
MDADTLQELRAVRSILGSILSRHRLWLGEDQEAVRRAKALLDGIVNRAERAQDATTGGE